MEFAGTTHQTVIRTFTKRGAQRAMFPDKYKRFTVKHQTTDQTSAVSIVHILQTEMFFWWD